MSGAHASYAAMMLMPVTTAGQFHIADLFSGPIGLKQHGMWELSLVVLFTTVAAPVAILYVPASVYPALTVVQIGDNLNKTLQGTSDIANGEQLEQSHASLRAALAGVQDLVKR